MTDQSPLLRARPPHNPPAFNVPGIVLALGAAAIAIHAATVLLLGEEGQIATLLWFAFIPLAYEVPADVLAHPLSPYWTPFSYAFLHGDWMHLGVNMIWLLAFGSAVARRFGTWRFLLFFLGSAAAGAALHYLMHAGSNIPMVGASASISACMGAAVRFAFRPGGMALGARRPALSLIASLSDRQNLTFILIWFAINFISASGLITPDGASGIAWEAHIGGFLFGLLAFRWFDPQMPAPTPPPPQESEQFLR